MELTPQRIIYHFDYLAFLHLAVSYHFTQDFHIEHQLVELVLHAQLFKEAFRVDRNVALLHLAQEFQKGKQVILLEESLYLAESVVLSQE